MSVHKKYSLVKEHDKHFELHDSTDNKTFHVSKKDMHPATQIKVMKMQKYAEGGKVNPLDPDPKKAKDAMKGAEEGQTLSKGWENLKKTFGGEEKTKQVAGYYDGGDVVPDYANTPVDDLKFSSAPVSDFSNSTIPIDEGLLSQRMDQIKAIPGALRGLWHQGAPLPEASAELANAPVQLSQQPVPGAPGQPAPSGQPDASLAGQPQPMAQAYGMPTLASLGSLEHQLTGGISREAEAEIAMNKEKNAPGGAYDSYQKTINEAHAKQQAFRDKLEISSNELVKALGEGKIDANQYWHQKGTGSKIATTLGVILSGIGAGLQHSTQNLALDVLQKNIDRDIQSQKDTLGIKQSMLSDNIKLYGSSIDGENATRIQAGAILQGDLQRIAAKSSDPLLRARAEQMKAKIGIEMMPLKSQLAMSQTQRDLRGQLMKGDQPMRKEDPALYVEHLVPEHNRAEVYKEIKMAQNTKRMSQSILSSFEQAAKENTVARTGAGLLRTPGSVTSLHQAMQPTFQDLEGTVRQAAMDNTFKNITPMPGDSEHKIQQKREALYEYLQSKASAPVAKGNGLDLGRFESTRPMDFVETKTMGGHQYQKVHGGWKKVK